MQVLLTLNGFLFSVRFFGLKLRITYVAFSGFSTTTLAAYAHAGLGIIRITMGHLYQMFVILRKYEIEV